MTSHESSNVAFDFPIRTVAVQESTDVPRDYEPPERQEFLTVQNRAFDL